MVGVVPDEGSRRRLPQWMLGVSAAEQVRKNDNVEKNSINLEEGHISSHPGKDLLVREKEKLLENSHRRAKCDPKRRKRNSKQRDADCDSNNPETLPDKESNGFGRKVSADRRRRKTAISKFGSSEELEVQPPNVDDVELTVEDLMIVAEEYVRTDKNMEREQASKGKCESESRLPTAISPTTESEGFVISDSYKSNGSLKSEQTVISASITGDPARDMLDLFLGPLLKKTLEKEKETEFMMDDVAFYPKFEMQSQKNMVMEEVAATTKKKSSLKDKVAMLLD